MEVDDSKTRGIETERSTRMECKSLLIENSRESLTAGTLAMFSFFGVQLRKIEYTHNEKQSKPKSLASVTEEK